jgi:heat shock protein HtpX
MARGRELFPADRGLQARMVLASVLTPLLVLAAVVAVVLVMPHKIAVYLLIAGALGVVLAIRAALTQNRGRPVSPAQAPELHAVTERLCAAASLPKPDIHLEPERQPNSWVVARPRRRAELHVTNGLVDLLEPVELEAVVAHELAHLANRDAAVMTVVSGPGVALQEGGAKLMRFHFWLAPGAFLAIGIGWVSRLGTNALSRYRELAADAGGAALPGRPDALASALRKASGRLQVIPMRDLRAVAGRDAFHLLPVAERDGGSRLVATHPDLERRIARLEAMERRLHHARLPHLHAGH